MAPSSPYELEIFVDEACTQKPQPGEVYQDYYVRNNAEIYVTPNPDILSPLFFETPSSESSVNASTFIYVVIDEPSTGTVQIYASLTIINEAETAYVTSIIELPYTEGEILVPKKVYHCHVDGTVADAAWSDTFATEGDWQRSN